MASSPQTVVIPQIKVRTMRVPIVGDSPLICHAWSEKAVRQMLDKQTGKGQQKKAPKEPFAEFCDSLYWLTKRPEKPTEKDVAKAKFGFPCVAFKSAAVSACRDAEGVKMTEARGRFHVVGEFAEIDGTPIVRRDMARVGMGTADIRFRGEFTVWKTTLTLSFNENAITPEQIVNLFNIAGFGVGVGEWRPERNGPYGRFHVGAE